MVPEMEWTLCVSSMSQPNALVLCRVLYRSPVHYINLLIVQL